MRLIFLGFGEFAIPSLISLIHGKHEVVGLVAVQRTEELKSRFEPCTTPVCRVAKRYGLPCVCLDDLLSVGSMKMLKALQADLGIVAAIELYLPKQLVEAFTCGCIGIHSSLLNGPRWVLNGDRKAAINVHRITDRPYSSPLLVQRETMIKPGETWAELHFGLSCIACDALNTTISMLEEKPMTSLNFKSIFGCVP